jgi:stringent starvation protein B
MRLLVLKRYRAGLYKGDAMSRDPQSKEAVVLQLLEEGDTTLCLDARREGVEVPRQHAQNPSLQLILNLNFPHPIHVSEDGISANLSFGGRRHTCYIPMAALWAVFNPQSMKGMMWPDSMPPEVQATLVAEQEKSERAGKITPLKARQQVGQDDLDQQTPAQPKTASSPRQRGHLRVIK